MKTSPLWHPTAIIGSPPEHANWITGTARFGEAIQPTHPPQVSRQARISPYVTIDAGCRRPTTIGEHTLLMAHAHIGHDAQIGNNVHIAPHVTIAGHAEIHDHAHIGCGAHILPYRTVGEGATVGAGAIVTKDIPPNTTVAGNPARQITRNTTPFTKRRTTT